MSRKPPKCQSPECSQKATRCLVWAESNICTSEEFFCEEHGRGRLHDWWQEQPGVKPHAPTSLFNRFEVALVVYPSDQSQAVAYLSEMGGLRRIPIAVGLLEAAGLIHSLKHRPSARPLTYEAMTSVITTLGGKVNDVLIDKLEGSVYYAKLRIRQDTNLLAVDMRPSDALNMAILSDCPITFAEEVLK